MTQQGTMYYNLWNWYIFKKDGKFDYFRGFNDASYEKRATKRTGNYKVSNGKITFTNSVEFKDGIKTGVYYPNTVVEYRIVKENGKERLKIPLISDNTKTKMSISEAWVFDKDK